MNKFKTILSIVILLALFGGLIYFEMNGRENRSTLKANAPEANLFTLYGDDHISFEEVDGIRVRTYFAEEKLELAEGVHTIKVSYKKRKFWILFTNEITSEYVFWPDLRPLVLSVSLEVVLL